MMEDPVPVATPATPATPAAEPKPAGTGGLDAAVKKAAEAKKNLPADAADKKDGKAGVKSPEAAKKEAENKAKETKPAAQIENIVAPKPGDKAPGSGAPEKVKAAPSPVTGDPITHTIKGNDAASNMKSGENKTESTTVKPVKDGVSVVQD